MENIELRLIPTEISVDDDGNLYCEGLVNQTDSWSQELGLNRKFVEKISKGVFAKAIARAPRIDFLVEHDNTKLLATTENGSLELLEDDQGLKMRAKIAQTSYGKDIYELMKEKMVNHMSFGMKVISDTWSKGITGVYQRVINDLDLREVSVVRNPAYTQSAIVARGLNVVEDVEIPDISEEKEEESELEIKNEIEKRAYFYSIDDSDDAVNTCLNLISASTQLLKFVSENTPENTAILTQLQKTIQVSSDILILQTQKPVEEPITDQIIEAITSIINQEDDEDEVADDDAIEEGEERNNETTVEKTEEKVSETEKVEPEVVEEKRSEEKIDFTELRKMIKEDLINE